MELLPDLRIIDFTTAIAGPYCTKLLADAGADVIKVEPPAGDPLRKRSVLGGRAEDTDSALFKFLNGGKRSVIGSPQDPHIVELIEGADIVIESFEEQSIAIAELAARHPSLVVGSISPFGRSGPWRDRSATEFTVEAESGTLGTRGDSGRPPFQAGGRLVEWVAGTYTAVAVLAAALRARRTGVGEVVDCSLLEVSNFSGSMFADLRHQQAGAPELTAPPRGLEVPSIEPTSDGYVGFNTNQRQQFDDFLVLIERPDLIDVEQWQTIAGRVERLSEWNEIVHSWTRRHSTAEIVETASLLRIPVGLVNNGKTVTEHPQFKAREIYQQLPGERIVGPVPPYRFDGERPAFRGRAPGLGEHQDSVEKRIRPESTGSGEPEGLPLAGIRVADFTNWWAGPSAGQMLGALGADVIRVESHIRLDGARLNAGEHISLPSWWERGCVYISSNTNKRSLTLDLATPSGIALAEKLLAVSDIVIENFSPRVFDSFGFTKEHLLEINPNLVIVRMPAFGLDGPWRNNVGFAQTMEQMSGQAWVTGYPDDQPRIVRGPCDPLAGQQAVFAALLGLSRREIIGHGTLAEVAMIESALNVAAEQVLEYSAYGGVIERQGNRSFDAAPQGLYPCRGSDNWLAVAVVTDQHWEALKEILGHPPWAEEPKLSSSDQRRQAYDEIDRRLSEFTGSCEVNELAERLVNAGVPAGIVRDARIARFHPQLASRSYFEHVEHPVAGALEFQGVPFKYGSVSRWIHRPAPTLGEHNHEILGELLGLDQARIEELEEAGVIGTRPPQL